MYTYLVQIVYVPMVRENNAHTSLIIFEVAIIIVLRVLSSIVFWLPWILSMLYFKLRFMPLGCIGLIIFIFYVIRIRYFVQVGTSALYQSVTLSMLNLSNNNIEFCIQIKFNHTASLYLWIYYSLVSMYVTVPYACLNNQFLC